MASLVGVQRGEQGVVDAGGDGQLLRLRVQLVELEVHAELEPDVALDRAARCTGGSPERAREHEQQVPPKARTKPAERDALKELLGRGCTARADAVLGLRWRRQLGRWAWLASAR